MHFCVLTHAARATNVCNGSLAVFYFQQWELLSISEISYNHGKKYMTKSSNSQAYERMIL